jgi:hypothetical protein
MESPGRCGLPSCKQRSIVAPNITVAYLPTHGSDDNRPWGRAHMTINRRKTLREFSLEFLDVAAIQDAAVETAAQMAIATSDEPVVKTNCTISLPVALTPMHQMQLRPARWN